MEATGFKLGGCPRLPLRTRRVSLALPLQPQQILPSKLRSYNYFGWI